MSIDNTIEVFDGSGARRKRAATVDSYGNLIPTVAIVYAAASAPSFTYTGNTNGSVGTTSTTLVAAGTYTSVLQIMTLPSSTANIWLNVSGGTAVVGKGLFVPFGGGSVNFGTAALPMPTGAINAITDGTSTVSVAMVGG